MELTEGPNLEVREVQNPLKMLGDLSKSDPIGTTLIEALTKCDEAKKLGKKEIDIATYVSQTNVNIEDLIDKLPPNLRELYYKLSKHNMNPVLRANVTINKNDPYPYTFNMVIVAKLGRRIKN